MSEKKELQIVDENLEIPEPKSRETMSLSLKERHFAVLWVTQPYHKKSINEMCNEAGFNRQYGYKVRQKPAFKKYCDELLDEFTYEFLPTVYKELHNMIVHGRSEKNRLDAIKVALTMAGKLTERQHITHSVDEEVFDVEEVKKRLEEERQTIIDIDIDSI